MCFQNTVHNTAIQLEFHMRYTDYNHVCASIFIWKGLGYTPSNLFEISIARLSCSIMGHKTSTWLCFEVFCRTSLFV